MSSSTLQATSGSEGKKKPEKDKSFVWTEEETALLVKVVADYKASKTMLGIEWGTV